ncbi:hypothetical protein, partial [Spongiactinospora sp. 9N601]|uniref:hypothetical protein n=1 Tax=Spongiactinospora sp. 9N601 TaxID=3375149 RepID=UPI0037B10F41
MLASTMQISNNNQTTHPSQHQTTNPKKEADAVYRQDKPRKKKKPRPETKEDPETTSPNSLP